MSSYECLKKILKLDNETYVISEQLKNYKEKPNDWEGFIKGIKYIFVGDNPGEEEQKNSTYFSDKGQTGKNIKNFTEKFLEIDFESNILFLNKSLISTPSTADLHDEDAGKDKSMELVAELIKEIKNENNKAIICIFGIDSLKKPYFKKFFETLNQSFCLYYHPSRRYTITNEQQDEFKKLKTNGKENELFKAYGKKLYDSLIVNEPFQKALDEIKPKS